MLFAPRSLRVRIGPRSGAHRGMGPVTIAVVLRPGHRLTAQSVYELSLDSSRFPNIKAENHKKDLTSTTNSKRSKGSIGKKNDRSRPTTFPKGHG